MTCILYCAVPGGDTPMSCLGMCAAKGRVFGPFCFEIEYRFSDMCLFDLGIAFG